MSLTDSSSNPQHGTIDDLTQLRVYVAVVETANFSTAARRLAMTPSTVSRHISDLESKLNAMLISRTTRQLVVTDVGKRFYEHCVSLLEQLGIAESEVEQYTREPKGMLRVTAPAVLAQRHISPYLPEFLVRYPGLTIDVILTSQTLDLIGEGIDLAIRVASEVDQNFVAIKLSPNRRVFAVAPAYLASRGTPLKPDDLLSHNCLTSRSERSSAPWPIREGESVRQLRVHGNLTADNGELLLESALQGVGIAMLPMFLAGPYLRTQRLVSVLNDFTVQSTNIYAILPHRKYVPRKARCFIEFVKEIFAPIAPWDR